MGHLITPKRLMSDPRKVETITKFKPHYISKY